MWAGLLSAPALGQFWSEYENTELGYAIDVPPLFESNGETADGAGAMFYRLEKEQGFSVWGAKALGGVEGAAKTETETLAGQGWVMVEQSITPEWAALMAQRDHRIIVERFIALCEGQSYAAFRMEFHIRDMNAMAEVLAGMRNSLRATGC